jgi:hypothetical protein
MTCSTMSPPVFSSSYGPGVARDVHHPRDHRSNSSNVSGRLSSALGQAEPVVDEHGLARLVAVEHRADLRQRHVALVDDEQPVPRVLARNAVPTLVLLDVPPDPAPERPAALGLPLAGGA